MFILINKPIGPTSHDVINQLRRITGLKKIGHAGTLDPFASGLLIVAVGRESTREIEQFVKLGKEYVATLKLGATSDTYDRTGKIVPSPQSPRLALASAKRAVPSLNTTTATTNTSPKLPITDYRLPITDYRLLITDNQNLISKKQIEDVLTSFLGPQLQTPPMFSAKKINGQKLYNLARRGQEVFRQPENIEIKTLEILDYQYPLLKIKVACSSGTYIRSLAHDLGQKLGVGAYLEELTRTKIGKYQLEDAISPDQLTPENWQTFTF